MSVSIIRNLLTLIGEDPDREGLVDTPRRVLKAWDERTTGYKQDPAELLKCFADGAANVDELVIVHNIPYVSVCVIAGTMVETPRGPMPINFLKSGDWVYTVDPDTLQLRLAKCKNPRLTRHRASLVRVYCNHDTLVCTPDHKVLTFNRGWVEALNLQPLDRIVSLYRSVSKEGYPHLSARGSKERQDTKLKIKYRGDNEVNEHDFVATQFHGVGGKRYSRIIHHCDEVKWNNLPENLKPVSIKEHNQLHRRFAAANTRGTAAYDKRLAGVIRSTKDLVVRAKRSQSMKQYWADAKNHQVIGVEILEQRADVWCMDVPNTHTFFANGMAVHNCEHHMADVIGMAHVGYIPDGRIVGLSKLARLVDCFARRLQVQERATVQIADALMEHLQPQGVGVLIRAHHACMSTRGVKIHGSVTTTSAMFGALREKGAARKEFLDLCMMAEGDK